MEIKFKKYIPTPTENKQLGIAEIIYGDFIFRFRINPGTNGEGFYVTPAAHKISDRWLSSFEVDSKSQWEDLLDFVKEHVKQVMYPKKELQMSASTFDTELPF